jgi:hypothetical protein
LGGCKLPLPATPSRRARRHGRRRSGVVHFSASDRTRESFGGTASKRTPASRGRTSPTRAAGLVARAHERTQAVRAIQTNPILAELLAKFDSRAPNEPDEPAGLMTRAHERTQAVRAIQMNPTRAAGMIGGHTRTQVGAKSERTRTRPGQTNPTSTGAGPRCAAATRPGTYWVAPAAATRALRSCPP